MKKLGWILLSVLCLSATACSSDEVRFILVDAGADNQGVAKKQVCQPFSTQACACGDNETGVRSCNVDGDGWSECTCSSGDTGTSSDGRDDFLDTDSVGSHLPDASSGDVSEEPDTETGSDTDRVQCTGGPCCDVARGVFLPLGYQCDTSVKYRCAGTGCGDDAQFRILRHQCSGTSAECDGQAVEYAWKVKDDCDFGELCHINETNESVCIPCVSGTWCSVDTCATCDDDDHCGEKCVVCEHGCNAAGDACHEDCNPAEDDCCEPDGTNCQHGCAEDGSCYPECNPKNHICCEADGTLVDDSWYDEEHSLCWQKSPSETVYEFYDAAAYCASRGASWRLPVIQELISLLDKGCETRTCQVSFPGCLEESCGSKDSCVGCGNKPSCHWDSDNLAGVCPSASDSAYYWSQSDVLDVPSKTWVVDFYSGAITSRSKSSSWSKHSVRCVRSQDRSCSGRMNENFDLGEGAFVHYPLDKGNDNDSWDKGTVSYLDGTVTCHSADGCWSTNQWGNYKWCESSALVSPMIDLSSCSGLQLVFWHWYRYENQVNDEWLDGAMVQISKNGGKDWADVTPSVPYQGIFKGECDSPNYGITYVQTDRQVWSGTTSGDSWQKVTIPIPKSHHTSMFRVRFVHGADQGPVDDSQEPYDRDLGWIVDDVAIE